MSERWPRKRWIALGALAAAIALGVVGFVLVRRPAERYVADVIAPRRIVLVLAPRNVSGAPEAGWIATSIAERPPLSSRGSLASSGPTNGALLIFKLPLRSLENRPLDLEIISPPDPHTGNRDTGRIELDV